MRLHRFVLRVSYFLTTRIVLGYKYVSLQTVPVMNGLYRSQSLVVFILDSSETLSDRRSTSSGPFVMTARLK